MWLLLSPGKNFNDFHLKEEHEKFREEKEELRLNIENKDKKVAELENKLDYLKAQKNQIQIPPK